jgi:amino acid adenylation domain-containing protein
MDFQKGAAAFENCIHYQFKLQVNRTPEAIALFSSFQETFTYRQLDQYANRLANYLLDQGILPETIVGVCMERSPEIVATLLGIMKAGGTYLPLDPAYPSERLAFMMEDSGAPLLLARESTQGKSPDGKHIRIMLDQEQMGINEYPETEPPVHVTGENLAYIIYTSGSSGRPKGVMGLHKGAINRFRWMWQAYPFEQGEVCCQKTGLSFVDSVWEIFGPLLQGVPSVLLSEDQSKDPEKMVQALAEHGVTRVVLVPSVLEAILSSKIDLNKRLVKLKYWTSSGEVLTADLARRFQERLPGRILLNIYGSSEMSADATWAEIPKILFEDHIPIGRPITGIRAYVLDENLRLIPSGEVGELYIGGVGLGRGYLNRPEMTAEKFIPDFLSGEAGERLYRTGDLVRLSLSGSLEYIGRVDQQIKLRGVRIEMGEIENLLRRLPKVLQAILDLREDGKGDKRLVAYVVQRPEDNVGISELRNYLQTRLPDGMMPSAFVILDSLPLTPNGKIDRLSLPAPDPRDYHQEQAYIPPRNLLEKSLARLWEEILGIQDIGIEDNFFAFGGHSLLAARLVLKIRDELDIELGLRQVFETPTIAGLAEAIQKGRRSAPISDSLDGIKAVPNRNVAPLSYFQQRLWFLEQLTPYTPTYNETIAFRLRGKLDIQALEDSLAEVIRRHEILRTTFSIMQREALQIIHPVKPFHLVMIDLSEEEQAGGSGSNPIEQTLARSLSEQASRYFNLRDGPLFRAILFKMQDEEYALQIIMHHSVCDEWSFGILKTEIGMLYSAHSHDILLTLEHIRFQYADFATWQRGRLRGERLDNLVTYWKNQLSGELPRIELPFDRPRPPVQTFRGANYYLGIPMSIVEGLRKLGQRQGATLFMTTLAGFVTLLHRYSGQTDLVLGTPAANRDLGGAEQLVGFFVNTLVLRSNLSGNPTFETLLSRVRETTLGVFEHQELPFEKLIEALQPERNLSYTPLFQIMFAFQNTPQKDLELNGLEVSPVVVENYVARFDLSLYMEETEHGMEITFNYSTDLFNESTIKRMGEHLGVLFEDIVAHPKRRVSDLTILGAEEKRQLLVDWNATDSAWNLAPFRCVNQIIEDQAINVPDAIALKFENETLTYGELDRWANQLARLLISQGIALETKVGLYMERSLEMFVGMLGIMKAGGAYMPLDREYPWERLVYMLKDSEAKILLTKANLLPDSMQEQDVKIICMDRDLDLIRQESDENPGVEVDPANLVYVIYTTGSTGKPKGVEVEHRQLLNYVYAIRERLNLEAGMNYAMVQPLAVDSVLTVVFPSLCTGGALHVLSRGSSLDSTMLGEYFRQYEIDCVKITPSHLAALESQSGGKTLLPKRRLILGGEASRREWIHALLQVADDCQIINHYGPTETTVGVLTNRMSEEDEGTTNLTAPLGRPLANTKIYILDDYLQPVPVGVPGELYIGGANVSRGYLKRPSLTAQLFVPDPFANSGNPGGRLYRTGDRARFLEDGNVEFLGRRDYQIKIRGYRVELGEIEVVLLDYPAIREVIVVYREFTNFPGEKRLAAYYVSSDNQTLSSSELRSFLRNRLPDYMLPNFFISLERLPLMQNGKVNRAALPDPQREGAETEGIKAPQSEVEMILAEIWVDVLNLEKISVGENFFDLGGHSLLAAQMINHVNDVFQVAIPLRSLFEHPTLAGMAQVIEEQLLFEIENLADEEVRNYL